MSKEFFIGKKIKQNRLVYASLHMIVMAFFSSYISIGVYVSPFNYKILLIHLLSYISGFIIEIGRKIEAPANEKVGVDNYSKLLGAKGASYLFITLCVFYSILSMILVIEKGIIFIIPLILFILLTFISTILFIIRLTPSSQKIMTLSTQILLMASFATFISLPFGE